MGIERGHAAGAPAAVTQRPAGGKAAAQGEAGGDFLAMLTALDTATPTGAELALVAEAASECDGADGKGRKPMAGEVWADPALPVPTDAAASMAAAAAAAPATPVTPVTPAGTVDGARSGPQAVEDAAADARAHRAEATPEAATARAGSAPAAALAPAAPAALAPEYASVFEQLKSRLAAQEAAAPVQTDAALPATRGIAAAAQTGQRDARGERGERGFGGAPASAGAWTRAEPVAAQAQVFEAMPARSGPRGEEGLGTVRGEPAWAPQEFTPTVQYDATLGSVDATPPPASPDQPLTEQLRYWVSQGMRSAELTVQGDADPVQVSISMQGNEAHVAFRSEHAATRDMLAGTVDQLRDLLQAQGMVLSGVSVGAHDAGNGRGGQPAGTEARVRPAAARAAAVEAALPAVSAAAAARTAAGSLDLYV